MRAYKDPTADTAIANVMREWKEKQDAGKKEIRRKRKRRIRRRRRKHKKGSVE